MELLNAIVITVNGVIWGWPMIILLLGTHIYMTAKTGFIQRFTITKGIRQDRCLHGERQRITCIRIG